MTLVTLEQTQAAMNELVIPGKQANGKVAFYIAAISAINPLDRNNEQGDVLRSYADKPLPENREELWIELGSNLFHSHINTLYEIEKLWNAGIIHFHTGSTYEEQASWRLSMAVAIPGMGMKTVSFALHIYSPFTCLILTIDRHHLKRLGFTCKSPTPKQYVQAESMLYQNLVDMSIYEQAGFMPIVYAACLWERFRQMTGKSKAKPGEYQTHAKLTCFV